MTEKTKYSRSSEEHPFLFSWLWILTAFVLSLLVVAVIFPELMLSPKIGHIRFADSEYNYAGVFALINNYYHGGIQLFNSYDQMPLAYYHLTGGLYTFANVLTSLIYILISPLFKFPGQAYHLIFSRSFFSIVIFLQTCGGYLLLRRFSSKPLVLISSIVVLNTLLSPHIYLGIDCSSLYVVFPLLMHFILKFFEEFRLDDLLLGILLFTACFFMHPMPTLSYFYQGLHFVILASAIGALLTYKGKIIGVLKSLFKFKKDDLIKIVISLVLVFVIVLPVALMFKVNYYDYDLAHDESRLVNPLSVSAYFKRVCAYAIKREALSLGVDYTKNEWWASWQYVGYLTIFLVLVGAVFSKDKRKYIFISTALLYWLINSPRDSASIGIVAHWINALTNPFKFLPRSFAMVGVFLIPYIIVPLLAMGLDHLYKLKIESGERKKAFFVIAILTIFTFFIFNNVSNKVHPYLLAAGAVSSFILIFLMFSKLSEKYNFMALSIALSMLLLMDMWGMSVYLKIVSGQCLMKPHSLKRMNLPGDVFLDYQNPKILPFRHFYRTFPAGQVDKYLTLDHKFMQGLFYRYALLIKYYVPATNYTPRHVSYSALSKIRVLPFYLIKSDHRLIEHVDYAVNEGQGNLGKLIARGRTNNIAVINDVELDNEAPIYDLSEVEGKVEKRKVSFIQKITQFSFKDADVYPMGDVVYYSFKLTDDFSVHDASTIYTKDSQVMRAMLSHSGQQRELEPAQGWLIRPYTYDISNVQTNRLVIALAKGQSIEGLDAIVMRFIGSGSRIINVWKYQPDEIGIDYTAIKDGWIVFHYPFDNKWKVMLNGKEQKIYRVNESFFGFPINVGDHKILVQYMPGSLMRISIGISVFLSIMLTVVVIALGVIGYAQIKDQNNQKE